jgi:hypothetical protein
VRNMLQLLNQRTTGFFRAVVYDSIISTTEVDQQVNRKNTE